MKIEQNSQAKNAGIIPGTEKDLAELALEKRLLLAGFKFTLSWQKDIINKLNQIDAKERKLGIDLKSKSIIKGDFKVLITNMYSVITRVLNEGNINNPRLTKQKKDLEDLALMIDDMTQLININGLEKYHEFIKAIKEGKNLVIQEPGEND